MIEVRMAQHDIVDVHDFLRPQIRRDDSLAGVEAARLHRPLRQRVDLTNGQVHFAGNEHHHLAGGDDRGRR